MGQIGLLEILLIVMVCLLLFGAKRLPEIGSAFGKAIRGFQSALKGEGADKDNKKTE